MFLFLSFWQAFLLAIVYLTFALWRLIDILNDGLGGNTVAAEFMLFIKTRQVPAFLLCRWPLYMASMACLGVRYLLGIGGVCDTSLRCFRNDALAGIATLPLLRHLLL